MDETTKVLLPLLLSPVLGVIAALATTSYTMRQTRERDREKEQEHIRLKVLNPLLVASEDLSRRLTDIKRRRKDPAKSGDMRRWFREIKERWRKDPREFAYWANDEGYFAMSTLYTTAVYFHYASTIRRDFPFIELRYGGATALLSHLSLVRFSIGGKFGIWEAMQDSLGAYLFAQEGGIKHYRQFCELVISETDAVWWNRLVDFYRDIHMKLDDHLDNIDSSLKALIAFLRQNLQLPTIQYTLTETSIAALRGRAIPPDLVTSLSALVGQEYRNEVDFLDALVACIGQDLADDFSPSILKCADKRSI